MPAMPTIEGVDNCFKCQPSPVPPTPAAANALRMTFWLMMEFVEGCKLALLSLLALITGPPRKTCHVVIQLTRTCTQFFRTPFPTTILSSLSPAVPPTSSPTSSVAPSRKDAFLPSLSRQQTLTHLNLPQKFNSLRSRPQLPQ